SKQITVTFMVFHEHEAANRCILVLSFCVLRPTSPNLVQLHKRALPTTPSEGGHSSAEQEYPTTGGDTSSLAFYRCLPARFCPEGIGTEPARSQVSGSRVLAIACGL